MAAWGVGVVAPTQGVFRDTDPPYLFYQVNHGWSGGAKYSTAATKEGGGEVGTAWRHLYGMRGGAPGLFLARSQLLRR